MSKEQLTGTIFYASKDAKRKHLYKEGQHLTVTPYSATEISPGFWQINLDSTGTDYIHLTQDSPDIDNAGFRDIYYHGKKVERDTTSFTQRVYLLEDDVIKSEKDMKESSDCMMKLLNDSDKWRADEQEG